MESKKYCLTNRYNNGVCNSTQKTDKNLYGLTLGTTYEWEVKLWYCDGQTTGWAPGPNFTTAAECPNVGNTNAYGVNPTKARFTWDDSNGAYEFVRIRMRVDSIVNVSLSDWFNVGGAGVSSSSSPSSSELSPSESAADSSAAAAPPPKRQRPRRPRRRRQGRRYLRQPY